MWILYQLAMAAALLAAAPFLLLRRGRHYLPTLRGRLGLTAAPATAADGRLWIHAVSVGEVAVAATLVRALPPELPLVVTTVTPTGQARARDAFKGRDAAVAYLPFDLGFAVERFWRRYRPAALVLVEGDYWPLLLRTARRRRLPVAVVNARLGERSFRRWRTLRRLAPALHDALGVPRRARFGVQTEEDRQRFLALGVDGRRLVVTGNLKFESPAPAPLPELEARLEELAAGRPILIAGSTMQGEDEAVLDAFAGVGAERALLVLVPRHPERWDAAVALAAARGLPSVRRSALDHRPAKRSPAVVLLDSFGELAALYRIAAAAFVGGTLVPTGGHNPLEPARFGVPIAVGPSMYNFRQIAAAFDDAGAWRRVADAGDLADCWRGWLDDPLAARQVGQRGRALVEANRGALERTRELLAPLLQQLPPGAPS
ncbi:MAG: 3-deoxy-D-manno-octulosonic acid transferase [Acidobacteria bacterium]|nr:MAG: 3-deoxy-D-manno-octulosonic acid transferase [Acidobacteriota bacterium]